MTPKILVSYLFLLLVVSNGLHAQTDEQVGRAELSRPKMVVPQRFNTWNCLSLSPDGASLAALHHDAAALYSAETGRLLRIEADRDAVHFQFSPTGELIFLSKDSIKIYDRIGMLSWAAFLSQSGDLYSSSQNAVPRPEGGFISAQWSGTGKRFATLQKNGVLGVHNMTGGAPIQTHAVLINSIKEAETCLEPARIAWDQDERWIAVVLGKNVVAVEATDDGLFVRMEETVSLEASSVVRSAEAGSFRIASDRMSYVLNGPEASLSASEFPNFNEESQPNEEFVRSLAGRVVSMAKKFGDRGFVFRAHHSEHFLDSERYEPIHRSMSLSFDQFQHKTFTSTIFGTRTLGRFAGSDDQVCVSANPSNRQILFGTGHGKCFVCQYDEGSVRKFAQVRHDLSGAIHCQWLSDSRAALVDGFTGRARLISLDKPLPPLPIAEQLASSYSVRCERGQALCGFDNGKCVAVVDGVRLRLMDGQFQHGEEKSPEPVVEVGFRNDSRAAIAIPRRGPIVRWLLPSGQFTGAGDNRIVGKPSHRPYSSEKNKEETIFVQAVGSVSQLWNVIRNGAMVEFLPDRVDRTSIGHDHGLARIRVKADGKLNDTWLDTQGVLCVAISTNSKRVAVGTMFGAVELFDSDGNRQKALSLGSSPVTCITAFRDGLFIAGCANGEVFEISTERGNARKLFLARHRDSENGIEPISSISVSPSGERIVASGWSGQLFLTADLFKQQNLIEVDDNVWQAAFLNDDSVLIASERKGVIVVDAAVSEVVGRLFGISADSAMFIAEDGRFDIVGQYELVSALGWVFDDAPYSSLSPEVFARDYYTPGLFAEVLAGKPASLNRTLSSLNRVQPPVSFLKVEAIEGEPDVVEVLVRVSGASDDFGVGKSKRVMSTGVYDLRLFRDGQLVGQHPPESLNSALPTIARTEEDLGRWRKASRVCGAEGEKTVKFRVQLPHNRASGEQIEFSAYAFNCDRVLSETATKKFSVPDGIQTLPPSAFLVGVGVDAYEGNVVRNLEYAAADARLLLNDLVPRFRTLGYSVDETALVSPVADATGATKRPKELAATKDNIRNAIAHVRETAGPDDVVMLCFSSHGYASEDGMFYLFPHDLGEENRQSVSEMSDMERKSFLAAECISSDELSSWLREVDASEIVMIVDTCHAAAAIEGAGDFKPGPMGSRGFGQLAYDKSMRILTASQAGDVALESNKVKHGLLTYALVCDGLKSQNADTDGNSQISLTEWLSYAERRVPVLFEEIYTNTFESSCDDLTLNSQIANSARTYEGKRRGDKQGATIPLQSGTPTVQSPRLFQFKNQEANSIILSKW
ncbi:MAG: caspase family protein [Planctomycetota bacterium]